MVYEILVDHPDAGVKTMTRLVRAHGGGQGAPAGGQFKARLYHIQCSRVTCAA